MKKMLFSLLFVAGSIGNPSFAADDMNIGFINFKQCLELSKQGKQEKNAFEALKKQMSDTLEKAEKELTQLASKLEDKDYLDGLSPIAEEELKQKFQILSQDFQRYQNQFYQLLNQANYKMLQSMHDSVSSAAEAIRVKNKLGLVINEESAFAYSPSLDLTKATVEEMNRVFDLQNKDQIASIEKK